jgi:hypothetical protein
MGELGLAPNGLVTKIKVSETIITTAEGQDGSFVSPQASNLRLKMFSPFGA